jgi:hypothetical protein
MTELTEAEVLAQASTVKPEVKQDELAILFESTKSFDVNGEQITIRPFSFGELPIVISLLKGVGSQFAYYQSKGTLNTVEGMMDVIAAGGENLIQALALNTGKDRQFFNKISPEDGVRIMQDFLMMNIGFFTQRVLPVIKGMK